MRMIYTKFDEFNKMNESEELNIKPIKKLPSKRINKVFEDDYFILYKFSTSTAMDYFLHMDFDYALWKDGYENFILVDKENSEKYIANATDGEIFTCDIEGYSISYGSYDLTNTPRELLVYIYENYCNDRLIKTSFDFGIQEEKDVDGNISRYLIFQTNDSIECFMNLNSNDMDFETIRNYLIGSDIDFDYYLDFDDYFQYIDFDDNVKSAILKLYSDDHNIINIIKDNEDSIKNLRDLHKLVIGVDEDFILVDSIRSYLESSLLDNIHTSIKNDVLKNFKTSDIDFIDNGGYKIELTESEYNDFIVIIALSNNEDDDDVEYLLEKFGYDISITEPYYGFMPDYSESGYVNYLQTYYINRDE